MIRFTCSLLVIASILFFQIGCATHKEAAATASAARTKPTTKRIPLIGQPLASSVRVERELAANHYSVETLRPKESQLAKLINGIMLGVDPEGRLVIRQRDPHVTPLNAPLFQDAITLTQLRGKLHRVDDLAPSVFSSARVDRGVAYLELPYRTSLQTAADTINTTLTVKDIEQLRIHLPADLLRH